MARDGSGNYSIPNTFVPSTTIASTAVNANFSDIATALTGSLARNSEGPMTAAIVLHQNGFNYEVDPDTGIKRSAANEMAMFAGGANVVVVGTATISIAVAVNIAGALAVGGTVAFSGTQTITGSSVGFVGQEIIGTDAGASGGPSLSLYRNSASPAAADVLGKISWSGNDSGANKIQYGQEFFLITDPTNGSTDADWVIQAVIAGAITTIIRSVGAQIQIPGSLAVTGNVSGADFSGANGTFSAALSGATAAGAMLASQADQETGTATNKVVAPGTQQFHPGHTKVWGTADFAAAVSASYNLTSVTDGGTGLITWNIGTDFSTANYGWQLTSRSDSVANGNGTWFSHAAPNPAAGTLPSRNVDANANNADAVQMSFAAFGDQ